MEESCSSSRTGDAASLIQSIVNIHIEVTKQQVPTSASVSQKVMVAFPGLGEVARIPIVLQNIRLLKSALGPNFKCSLQIWPHGASTNPEYAAARFAPCQVKYSEGQRLFAGVKAVKVPTSEVDSVFLLLDDISMKNSTLPTLQRLLSQPDMHVASASYQGAWCSNMHPRTGITAHESHFVEMNAVLFKTKAFLCLQSIIDTEINPLGFGYDNMYAAMCGVRMAVCDACEVQHGSIQQDWAKSETHKVTYNHQHAMDQMNKWFASLQNTTGMDVCDSSQPTPPLAFALE